MQLARAQVKDVEEQERFNEQFKSYRREVWSLRDVNKLASKDGSGLCRKTKLYQVQEKLDGAEERI